MLVGFDIETCVATGEPVCITWSIAARDPASAGWTAGAPCGLHARDPRARRWFEGLLADDAVVFVGQNIAFDLVRLGTWWGLLGAVREVYEAGRVRDTMLRQNLVDIAWPAKIHGEWNEELGRWFPAKFAWHAGLRRRIRIDGGEDDEGGKFGSKGGLDGLAWRLLAVDISGLKHDQGAPRLRYGEMLDVAWEDWPAEFRDYALGDPQLTLAVYIEQWNVVRARVRGAADYEVDGADTLPPLFAEGWRADEVEAPLCDEQFQVMAAVPFQMMSQRGVRVDRELVRRQRAELRALQAWAAELCVKYGSMYEKYEFAPGGEPGSRVKPLRKGEVPSEERIYRSIKSRCHSLRESDPAAFEAFVALARKLGKLKSIERKVNDGEKRRRVGAILERRGLPLVHTKKRNKDGTQKIKADADLLYDAARPTAEAIATGLARGDHAAEDLSEVLGPNLLKIARKALAGAGGWSLERLAAAIEAAEDAGLAALAVHAKAEKFDSSFLRRLDDDADSSDAVYAWFRTMMDTGRTSMSGPIRQNMPKSGGVRECIVPRPGYVFVQCDYSQIEMLGLAYVLDWLFGRESKLTVAIRSETDCHLLLACHPLLGLGMDYATAKAARKLGNGYLEAAGSDRAAAEAAHPEYDWALLDRIEKARFSAKAANFGFPGGMMPRKFAATQKKQNNIILTIEDATLLRTAWLETWPEVGDYFDWAKGKTSGSRTARVRHLDGGGEGGHWRGGCGYTQLCNSLFQGLVARGAKWCAWQLFIACYLTPGGVLEGCHPVLFVHDEFVLEAPIGREAAALEALRSLMEGSMLSVMPGQAVRAEGKVLAERWTK